MDYSQGGKYVSLWTERIEIPQIKIIHKAVATSYVDYSFSNSSVTVHHPRMFSKWIQMGKDQDKIHL